ncbi:LysR family transcriptional regulator [Acetobacter senegalensis]|uniref:LysR family transcriptional regulator n=1 Tax=Acetobacter senegalensis TaxID=446692 RepID=A0A149U081_9PROT|nr:LysR family transcriptional regulator ArgP [Acetobacter senegalensis]KXV58757.1 LysR family transcriptional regulator [Acetobacter senegalensis]
MLDYNALAAVSAVIREGSFDGAARKLNITASAVSQRVRGYEDRLGALLIIRGQPCRPTDLGRALVTHLDRVHLLEAEIPHLSHASGLLSQPEVTLRIAVNADSLATWFSGAISRFATDAAICLDLLVEDETCTADRLRSGEVTAAITAQTEPVPGCRSVLLGAMQYVACATPGFMARYFSAGGTAAEFKEAPCICFDRDDGLEARWLHALHKTDLPRRIHYIPSTHGFLDFTLNSVGWGLQPLALVDRYLSLGNLIEIVPGRRLTVDLYWTIPRVKSKLLNDLTLHLKNECSRCFWLDENTNNHDILSI